MFLLNQRNVFTIVDYEYKAAKHDEVLGEIGRLIFFFKVKIRP